MAMFRSLVRKKQQLTEEECLRLLQEEKRGVLSVIGDDGYPYGMPLNHYYDPADGKIYFHSGKAGHKIDALQRCSKASYCIYDSGFRKDGEWALNIRSVIVFGRVQTVTDPQKALEICRALSYRFTQDDAYIQKEIEHFGAGVLVLALTPEQITGKLVNEA